MKLTCVFAALGIATIASSCLWRGVQRWPGPMQATVVPLPAGDAADHRPGPEEVTVIRHADPVQVRPAGALSGRPMEFFDKRAQLNAGGAVIVAPGGRAEVIWPSGSSTVLFGEALGWIGSPSRGEPMFEFDELDRARFDLRKGESVRLLGGALLSGEGGPYVLERGVDDVVTVHNQGKDALSIAFREELFDLAPGQAVRIPLISSGGAPFVDDPSLQRFDGERFNVRLGGDLTCEERDGRILVRAPDGVEGQARALGVRVQLAPGESAAFLQPTPPPKVTADAASPAVDPAQNDARPEQPAKPANQNDND